MQEIDNLYLQDLTFKDSTIFLEKYLSSWILSAIQSCSVSGLKSNKTSLLNSTFSEGLITSKSLNTLYESKDPVALITKETINKINMMNLSKILGY